MNIQLFSFDIIIENETLFIFMPNFVKIRKEKKDFSLLFKKKQQQNIYIFSHLIENHDVNSLLFQLCCHSQHHQIYLKHC